ncbi:MAG: hypothetical protein HRU15_00340 [Planctomycetes bacterium]|nr:hypothetical protein [Planctomycetota bacterium]
MMMKSVALIALIVLVCLPQVALAATVAEADAFYDQAMTAMEKMNDDSSKSVEAAVLLYKAKGIYAELESWPQVREVNSYIFFCKKKMNIDELDAYIAQLGRTQGDEVRKTFKLIEVETSQGLSTEDSALSYQEAEQFASDSPDEYLKIHMRFLEISERAIESNSALAIKASRKSSDALQQWVQSQKQIGPASPFNKPKRTINLLGENAGFAVPGKKEIKTIKRGVQNKYKQQLSGSFIAQFSTELYKTGKESLDQPAYAYVCVMQAAELALDKNVNNISLAMDCLSFIEENFAVTDIGKMRMDVMKTSRSAAGKAAVKLFADPDDEKSNTLVGLSYCLIGGNWEDGSIMLQKGDDDDLKRIAAMEVTKPSKASEQKQLADAWYELVGNKKFKSNKLAMLQRSVHWYATAVPQLMGISKDQADKRMLKAALILPIRGLEGYASMKLADGAVLSEKKWDACRAKRGAALANKVNYTGVDLLPGQKIRIMPHVSQQWNVSMGRSVGYKGGNSWYTGDPHKIGEFVIRVGEAGTLRDSTKTIEGRGRVYVICNGSTRSSRFGSSNTGSIDYKIIAVPRR